MRRYEDEFSNVKILDLFGRQGGASLSTPFKGIYVKPNGEDKFNCVNAITDRYQFVGHGQVIDTVKENVAAKFDLANITQKVEISSNGAELNFEMLINEPVRFSDSSIDHTIGFPWADENRPDEFFPVISVNNSYSSSSSLRVNLDGFRGICANGVPIGRMFSFYICKRHVGEIGKLNFDIDEVIDKFMMFINNMNTMQERKINAKDNDEIQKHLEDEVGKKLGLAYLEYMNLAFEALKQKKIEMISAYIVFNVLTYIFTHHSKSADRMWYANNVIRKFVV